MNGLNNNRKEINKQNLKKSRLYGWLQNITKYFDQYYIDAIAGFIPGGIGDILAAVFALFHVYFSAFRLHSIPLTMAILNNVLRDILLGMIPFYVGNVIDFFHKANKKNMQLIDGFINNDQDVIQEVNRKAVKSLILLITFFISIILMTLFLVWLVQAIGTIIFS